MTAPITAPQFVYAGELDPTNAGDDQPGDWTITFGFGKPAAGTYTAVRFTDDVAGLQLPEAVLQEVVRRVAVEMYGTAWAFLYRPDQYDEAITRWKLRRRERVLVHAVEVW